MIDFYVYRNATILRSFNGYDSVPMSTTRNNAISLAKTLASGNDDAIYSVESRIRELPYTPGITEWSSDS